MLVFLPEKPENPANTCVKFRPRCQESRNSGREKTYSGLGISQLARML